MKKRLPQTIEGVCRQKRGFMFLLQAEPDKDVYEQAVNHCDRLIARITERSNRRFRLFVLLLCLGLSGCETGKCVGTLFKGVGSDVEQLNQGYMDRHGR